jgi:hypothetical protein
MQLERKYEGGFDDGLGLWVMNADGSDPHYIGPDDGQVPA